MELGVEIVIDLLNKVPGSILGLIRRFGVVDVNWNPAITDLESNLLAGARICNNAEEEQISDIDKKDFVDHVKSQYYDGQDLLEKFHVRCLHSKHNSEFGSTASKVFHCFSEQLFSSNKKLGAEIEAYNRSFHNTMKVKDSVYRDLEVEEEEEAYGRSFKCLLKAKNDVYNWDKECYNQNRRRRSTRRHQLVDDSTIYGRDFDLEEVVKSLLVSGNKIQPLVGRDGMGKTCFAKLVFGDERITSNFDPLVWVSVSYTLDVRITTKQFEVTPQTYNAKDFRLLGYRLRENLVGKKFLLVLDHDDNCNSSIDWEVLHHIISEFGENGSKIIVVASDGVEMPDIGISIHHVNPISDHQDCWKIFEKYAITAFGRTVEDEHKTRVGKTIVKKCQGIPLAIKLIGSVLRFQPCAKVWEQIEAHPHWESENKILAALRLSYFCLPQHLKTCFTFCSIYPSGCKFTMKGLILLWRALNILNSKEIPDEKVLEEYFHDLQSRSLIHKSGQNSELGFTMHGIVNDFARSRLGNFCSRLENNKYPVQKTRFFSFLRSTWTNDFEKFLDALSECKNLRAFLPLGMEENEDFRCSIPSLDRFFKCHVCLRVVSLSNFPIEELPASIGNLVLLRYLDLSHTRLKKIPNEVCTLLLLEMLLLVNCSFLTRLPDNLERLPNLRLEVTGTPLEQIPHELQIRAES